MDWINAKEQPPKPYQDIIICSDEGKVKPATYLGNGKYNTFLNVEWWQPYPAPPKTIETETEAPKKRGRPKKI